MSERYDKEERSRRETEERQRLGPSIRVQEGRRTGLLLDPIGERTQRDRGEKKPETKAS